MPHQNTIVDFKERYTAVRETNNNNVPELAKSAERIAKKQLHDYLQKMFDNVDDSLFDYADKAQNNQQQTLYFDAMREIRVQRNKVEKAFTLNCNKLAQAILAGGSLKDDTSDGTVSGERNEVAMVTLSLVEEDDLEESLAITNMVAKAHHLYREELIAIAHRFSEIVAGPAMTADNNPVSPDLICKAFEQASESFAGELEIRLIVYKLFDKFVMSHLGEMYKEINAMFVAAGVLPVIKLKAPVTANSHAARPSYIDDELLPGLQSGEMVETCRDAPETHHGAAAYGASVHEADANKHLFESMQQLLALQRVGAQGPAGHPQSAFTVTTASAADGSPGGGYPASQGDALPSESGFYVTNDIIAGLSHLQSNANAVEFSDNSVASGDGIKATLLNAINVNQPSEQSKSLEHTESDVIDIVSMMFDFILDDKTLSDAIRALIARLQIPIIKLAILDKTFFSKKTHAARLLLNELAYAGSVLDDEADLDNGSLYKEVNDVVNCVLTEFDTDVSIFDDLLLRFRDFIETELEANKLAEAMLADVKQQVSDKLEASLHQYKIPVFVHNFVVGKWKDVLTEIGLRDHCDGIAWQVALNLVDDLVWSVQPKLQVGERQELVRIIPKILNGLQDGLILIGTEQEEINSYLQELEVLHLACLRGIRENTESCASQRLGHSAEQSSHQYDELDLHAASVMQPDPTQATNPSYSSDEDLTYTGLTPTIINTQIQAFVRDMEIGVWVEFYNKDKIKRGKLSWKCDFTGDYTFVDRRYRVVADVAMSDLVKRLESGKAAIVEDVPLLDRAIDAVVNSMKRCVDGAHELVPT